MNQTKWKTNEIDKTVDYILSHSYGDIITDEKLSKILKYNIAYVEEYNKYKIMMNKIKNILISKKYIIKRVGTGYYIMKPSQVANYCYRKNITHAHNIVKKGIYILQNVDDSDLKTDRKEELENLTNLSTEINDKIQETINKSKYYSRIDYYNSLKD